MQDSEQAKNGQKNEQQTNGQTNGPLKRKRSLLIGAVLLVLAAAAAAGIAARGLSPAAQAESAAAKGSGYLELQQYDLAADALESALALQEDAAESGQAQDSLTVRQLLMESYAGAGDYEAIAELLEAGSLSLSEVEREELEESALDLLTEGARTACASGDTALAVQLYEMVAELAGEESEAGEEAGRMLEDLVLELALEESLSSFAAVLEQDPDNAAALKMTAQLLAAQGEYADAVTYYERLQELSGAEDFSGEIALCWAQIAAGLSGEDAAGAWETVLTWDPSDEEAYLELSSIYMELGDSQSALLILEQGAELTGSEEILARYEELNVTEFEQLVIEIIDSITTEDMTAEEKRRACYDYIIDTTTYVRTYDTPEGDWTKDYAFDVLAKRQGNCFRYAAAFAYLCRELGYDAKVCTGEVSAASGGTTPHGWVMLTVGGVEYLCDPDLEQSLGYDFYMKTYEEYPVKPLITEEEWEIEF